MIKQIPGFNNYFADTEGNIYSNKSGKLKKLNPWSKKDNRRQKTENNYLNVELDKQCFMVHRLIAMTFIDNPNNKTQINHINGIKYDNRVDNLEWCNNDENQKHAYKNNLNHKKTPGNAKLNYQIAEEIRKKYSTKQYTQKQLGVEYNVSKTTIGDIVRNKYYIKDYNISNV